jgi:N-dimethylarginine dimethylaminohydrolase
MCRPDYFQNAGKIFAPVAALAIDSSQVLTEWQALYDLLTGPLKQSIELMTPLEGLSGMVLAADACVLKKRILIRSNFRQKGRVGEEIFWEKHFKKQGYQVKTLEKPLCLEGGADTVWMNDDWYGVCRSRADHEGFEAALAYLKAPFFPLEIKDPRFRRLDFCFRPLDEKRAMLFPGAFDGCSQMILRENIQDLIEVPEKEALAGACGATVLGHAVILPEGCPKTEKKLEEWQFVVYSIDWQMFAQLGCGPAALVMRL